MNRLLAYAQLLRLPNVFTALADIGLAAVAAGVLPAQAVAVCWLGLASACLYSAGMVWNDYFDRYQDERERPFRPIPSGRVTLAAARLLGSGLMLAGLLCAALADIQVREGLGQATLWAGLLIGLIFAYDGGLKRTAVGPLLMGGCRMVNVLLGLSVSPEGNSGWGWLLALVVGIYIAGVTWFARREAQVSQPTALAGAAAVILGSLLLAVALPVLAAPGDLADDPDQTLPLAVLWGRRLFPYLLLLFAAYLGPALLHAIRRPQPLYVQAAVRRAILGLIPLDAILATGLAGLAGLLLLGLLVPTWYLGRRLYST
jgi:hypothetical protein